MTPNPPGELCPRCSGRVIRARDRLFGDVVLDPLELDPMGELGAVLAGVETYEVGLDLGAVHRSAFTMRHRPAGTRPRRTVHPAHRCEGGSPP